MAELSPPAGVLEIRTAAPRVLRWCTQWTRWLLSDARPDLFATCSIEAFIECQIRKCAPQHMVWWAKPTTFPRRELICQFALVLFAGLLSFSSLQAQTG